MLLTAINSVLNQTYDIHEILVCDDGSTDDSKKLVTELNSEKVIWVDCGKNGRPAIPRNMGVYKSTGNWIAFLDNDDEWLPNKIETQLKAIKDLNVLAVCTNAHKISDGKNLGVFNTTLKNNQLLNFNSIVNSNHIICSSALVNKEIVLKFGCFPEEVELRALEDYALWLRISTSYPFYYLNDCLVNYNDNSTTSIRKESLTTQKQLRIIFKNFKNWHLRNTDLRERYLLLIIEEIFVLKFLNNRQRFFYKLFKHLNF